MYIEFYTTLWRENLLFQKFAQIIIEAGIDDEIEFQ